MALPLPLRNRLAEVILDSLHDPGARNLLSALAADGEAAPARAMLASRFPQALGKEYGPFREELCRRARRAWEVLRERPLAPPEPPLAETLDQAADLFDARLFFEVHELLEPSWMRADGAPREALQGLIQIAVGFQHLDNGNVDGARMLLREGSQRADGKRLDALDLGAFARAVRGSLDTILALGAAASRAFDWTGLPPFPRRG